MRNEWIRMDLWIAYSYNFAHQLIPLGMLVGLIIALGLSPESPIRDSVTFDYQFFFNLLLPPIILASGYELHQVSVIVLFFFFFFFGYILELAYSCSFIPGEFLPKYWHYPYICFCGNLHLCHCVGSGVVSMDTHSFGWPQHFICGGNCSWSDALCDGPCYHSRHLQPVQGGAETLHGHLWRIYFERCYCDCAV